MLDPESNHATLVDWQLDCSNPVRIEEALGSRGAQSSFLDPLETDEGYYRVAVIDLEEALGSRAQGAEVRNRLANYILAANSHVILDFSGVGVISSSFADEVLGKLAVEMTELEFRRRVFVDNASITNRALIETAIARRLEVGI